MVKDVLNNYQNFLNSSYQISSNNNIFDISSIITAGSAPLAGECTLDYDVIIENNGCAQACHVL